MRARRSVRTADLMKKGSRRAHPGHAELRLEVRTADLMKKGSRPDTAMRAASRPSQNRRPDEEGIKTPDFGHSSPVARVRTADLMKKGSRRDLLGLLQCGRNVRTADLMKKGSRLQTGDRIGSPIGQNRRPDEEGIKTLPHLLS